MSRLRTLTINDSKYNVVPVAPVTSVTLYASDWEGDGDTFYQVANLPGVKVNTKVDLQPTVEQLQEFHHRVLGFVTENEGGVVTVYAIGDKPTDDHIIQVTLTEVEATGRIRGNTVGTTTPRANLGQEDPTRADYVVGRDAFLEAIANLKPNDAVQYTAQDLTDAQKAQARANIGALSQNDVDSRIEDTVRYTDQSLTNAQKTQARKNIGALSEEDVGLSFDGGYIDTRGFMHLTVDGKDVPTDVFTPFYVGTGGGGGNTGWYTITLTNLMDSRILTVAEGESVVLKVSYTSIDEDGLDDGSGIGQILVGGSVRKTFTFPQGSKEIDVTEYLSAGNNDVSIKVTNSEGYSKTMPYTITLATVSIVSSFDAGTPRTGAFSFPYVPVGIATKTVYFEVDGAIIGTAIVTTSGRQVSYTIPAQSHGAHVLRVWFTCTIGETEMSSNVLYYGIICAESGNATPIIAITTPPIESVEQYDNLVMKYRVYDPSGLTAAITLMVNGKTISSITTDRTEQTWTYRPTDMGEVVQTIRCGNAYAMRTTTVTESTVKVEAETEALALHLTSYGRSNNEANPGVWENSGISATFTGFNFTTDGWLLDDDNITVLRVTGDARLSIPYKIFANDFRTTGKTLEFELATREVLNYDAEVLSCYSGGRGFKITAQQLMMASEQSNLGTRYKEDEHLRVTIVAEKRTENRLLLCYINGIMSGAVQYPDDDDFAQTTPVGITIGSNECTIDLYNIRAYDNSLTRHQVLDNWIADTQDYGEKTDRFKRNGVYDEYGRIVISKLPNDLPYLVLQGAELPQFKDDKKTINGYFVDPMHPERNFTLENAQIDVQGTSSQYYYVKNYKIKGKNGFIAYDGSTVSVYAMNDNAVPVDTFTMKADVASSEGAFNVVLAMIYNDLCPFKTPAQEDNDKVRQCIEGFPIVIFWEKDGEMKFLGKYNFNNDKGTAEVFGFTSGDESWEILQNGTDRVGWHSADFSDDSWKDDFEARYPDKNTNTTRLKALAEWLVSTDTDKATGNTISPVEYGGVVYSKDTKEYRLAKFSAELSQHFVEEAIIFYYLFTEIFLSIDQREKNAFPTYIKELDRWIVLFYDADSSLGTDNKGNLTFDYYLEDIDYTQGGDPVYNGQNSVLWKNLRATRYDKIMAMYKGFRTNGQISYDGVIGRFEEHQSKWPEAIFNEDMHRKCLEPLIESGDGLYLPMLQGKKEMWMKWWLYNRFRYLDSKYCTGTSMTNRITIRTHAMANITLSSYVNMYGHVFYNAEQVEHRMDRGKEYEFVSQASGAEDRVIGINDADMLTSLGDLSPHMVELIDISKATHLTELKVGDAAKDYANYSLNNITLGNNILLRTLDVRNCPNLTQTVDISGCTNIEEIYFDGTSVTGLNLPNGGILKRLHLPGTVANLTIRNQPSLTEFVMPSYNQITTLRLENAGVLDGLASNIVNEIPANSRVRIIGFNKEMNNFELYTFLTKLDTMRGLDESGNNTELAQISGHVYVEEIGSSTLAKAAKYTGLTVEYGNIVVYSARLVERTMIGDYTNDRVTTIGAHTFRNMTNMMGSVSFPNVVTVGTNIFSSTRLAKLSLPRVEKVGTSVFNDANVLVLELPSVKSITGEAFVLTTSCDRLILPSVTSLASACFNQFISLKELILPGDTLCVLGGVLSKTSIDLTSIGFIYVPANLYNAYASATNWSQYAGRLRKLEDYTVDGTTTGELDKTKI